MPVFAFFFFLHAFFFFFGGGVPQGSVERRLQDYFLLAFFVGR